MTESAAAFLTALAEAIAALVLAMTPTLFTGPAVDLGGPPPVDGQVLVAETDDGQHDGPIRCARRMGHDGTVVEFEIVASGSNAQALLDRSAGDPDLFCMPIEPAAGP